MTRINDKPLPVVGISTGKEFVYYPRAPWRFRMNNQAQGAFSINSKMFWSACFLISKTGYNPKCDKNELYFDDKNKISNNEQLRLNTQSHWDEQDRRRAEWWEQQRRRYENST